MPILNFKKQFAKDVSLGIKRQTIRPIRKRPIKIGDMLHLYTGLRTKYTQLLRREFLRSAWTIDIYEYSVRIADQALGLSEIDELAQNDGFENRHQFFSFFQKQYGLPFHGILYKW